MKFELGAKPWFAMSCLGGQDPRASAEIKREAKAAKYGVCYRSIIVDEIHGRWYPVCIDSFITSR